MSSLDEAPSDYSYGDEGDDVMSDDDDDYGFDTDVEGKKVRERREESAARVRRALAHASRRQQQRPCRHPPPMFPAPLLLT